MLCTSLIATLENVFLAAADRAGRCRQWQKISSGERRLSRGKRRGEEALLNDQTINFFLLSLEIRSVSRNCSFLPPFVFHRIPLSATDYVCNDERFLRQQMFGSPSTPILENPEYQTRWYFKYFLGKRKLSIPVFYVVVYYVEYICNIILSLQLQ